MRALTVLLLALAACGPSVEPRADEVASQSSAIIFGQPAPADSAVFMLLRNNAPFCTATLIEPQTLLTAAHCVSGTDRATGRQVLTISGVRASNAPSVSQLASGETLNVTAGRLHPSWGGTTGADLALLRLERAPAVEPRRWNWDATEDWVGATLRSVGFGQTESGTSGQRRQVNTLVTSVDDSVRPFGSIIFSGSTRGGVCFGDSGGPAFRTFPDGSERVVGVHSFVTGGCGNSGHVRVDVYAEFIREWIRETEAPSCSRDWRCVQSCATPDIDCLCGEDGRCSADCPDLIDPDCPANCRADGYCSTQTCPRLDMDCIAEGAACEKATESRCPGRRCVSDGTLADSYCSRACASDEVCSVGMVCDGALGICRVPAPPVFSPLAPTLFTRGQTGCSSAPSGAWLLGVAALLGGRRRARRS